MNIQNSFENQRRTLSRRRFLKSSGMATAGTLAISQMPNLRVSAAEVPLLKVGLIGCGGRGTGAAAEALNADANVKLVAMADVFEEKIGSSLKTLREQPGLAEKIDVPEHRRFTGFRGGQELIGTNVDVVLLAEPPHFRPMHLKAAVKAGKHVFAEKPVAVDAPGVRSVIEVCEEAKKKKLSVVSGLCLRYSDGFREGVKQIREGAIGEIRVLQANDYRGPIWVKPRQESWSDMEWQMRNWYYFTWLSGDFNVEQHVHYLDVCAWIMDGEYPISAKGLGGRQVRTGAEYGNIYDHHSVIYEYANGVRLFANCCQQANCRNDISAHAIGSNGMAEFSSRRIAVKGDNEWMFRGEKDNPYQQEHDELFASIRNGKPINNGEYMAKSTLMAIMGRMATYTGQTIQWDQAMESNEDLSPKKYEWGPLPTPAVAIPGMTKFI